MHPLFSDAYENDERYHGTMIQGVVCVDALLRVWLQVSMSESSYRQCIVATLLNGSVY